jgi:hypothetical protein
VTLQVPEKPSAFHPLVQRNASHHRGARQQSIFTALVCLNFQTMPELAARDAAVPLPLHGSSGTDLPCFNVTQVENRFLVDFG